jgi:hypothetical protein
MPYALIKKRPQILTPLSRFRITRPPQTPKRPFFLKRRKLCFENMSFVQNHRVNSVLKGINYQLNTVSFVEVNLFIDAPTAMKLLKRKYRCIVADVENV